MEGSIEVIGRSKESQEPNSLELMQLPIQISHGGSSSTDWSNVVSVLDWQHLRPTSVDKAVPSPGLVRFGTFEVDLRAGEVRKSGVKLRLTGQPFQILAILLETPRELVTREELQKRRCSCVLICTKRMFCLVTASAIASASMKSFLFDLR